MVGLLACWWWSGVKRSSRVEIHLGQCLQCIDKRIELLTFCPHSTSVGVVWSLPEAPLNAFVAGYSIGVGHVVGNWDGLRLSALLARGVAVRHNLMVFVGGLSDEERCELMSMKYA